MAMGIRAAARAREEIVEAIIADLKPLNARISLGEIRWAVEECVIYLFEIDTRGQRPTTETKEAAQRLQEPLNSIIQALKEIPPNNLLARPELLEELIELEEYRAGLAASIPSRNLDMRKTLCAATAAAIITRCSQQRPGPSLMQTITRHLYELVTGNHDDEMTRACDKMLRIMRVSRLPVAQLLAGAMMNRNWDIPLVAMLEYIASPGDSGDGEK
jgi:hypothetical protein